MGQTPVTHNPTSRIINADPNKVGVPTLCRRRHRGPSVRRFMQAHGLDIRQAFCKRGLQRIVVRSVVILTEASPSTLCWGSEWMEIPKDDSSSRLSDLIGCVGLKRLTQGCQSCHRGQVMTH